MNCAGRNQIRFGIAVSLCILGVQVSSVAAQQQNSEEIKNGLAESAAIAPLQGDYYVVNQPLTEFLQMFARDLNLRVDVSPAVRGTIRNRAYSGSVEAVLGKVARIYSVDWFQFNGVYYVSARSEATTRLTRLGALGAPEAISILTESGLVMERYPVSQVAGQSTLALSGPPKLLAIAEAIVEAVPSKPSATTSAAPTIVVRRGTEKAREEIN